MGSRMFRSETEFLYWKQDFEIDNVIFRLETGFVA